MINHIITSIIQITYFISLKDWLAQQKLTSILLFCGIFLIISCTIVYFFIKKRTQRNVSNLKKVIAVPGEKKIIPTQTVFRKGLFFKYYFHLVFIDEGIVIAAFSPSYTYRSFIDYSSIKMCTVIERLGKIESELKLSLKNMRNCPTYFTLQSSVHTLLVSNQFKSEGIITDYYLEDRKFVTI